MENNHPSRKVFDPVCDMELDIENVRHSFEHEGTEYHFCSEKCKTEFIYDPEQFIKKDGEDHKNHSKHGCCH